MDMKDGLGRVIGLAMAGKSPWGGGKKPDGEPEPEVPAGDEPAVRLARGHGAGAAPSPWLEWATGVNSSLLLPAN